MKNFEQKQKEAKNLYVAEIKALINYFDKYDLEPIRKRLVQKYLNQKMKIMTEPGKLAYTDYIIPYALPYDCIEYALITDIKKDFGTVEAFKDYQKLHAIAYEFSISKENLIKYTGFSYRLNCIFFIIGKSIGKYPTWDQVNVMQQKYSADFETYQKFYVEEYDLYIKWYKNNKLDVSTLGPNNFKIIREQIKQLHGIYKNNRLPY